MGKRNGDVVGRLLVSIPRHNAIKKSIVPMLGDRRYVVMEYANRYDIHVRLGDWRRRY